MPLKWLLEESSSRRLKDENLTSWDSPQHSCITCQFEKTGSKSFRWWNEDRSEIVEWECNCIHQWIMNRYMLSSGIGTSYQRLGWADAVKVAPAIREAVDGYREHADAFVNAGLGLVFHSEAHGTGKTMSMSLLAKQLMFMGYDVYAAMMSEIVTQYTSGWRSSDAQKYFERRIMNCQVLLLDEMGRERGTNGVEFLDRMVDQVIRRRVSDSAPTLITTNLPKERIHQAYGDNILSLLTETCEFVEVMGADFRGSMRARTVDEAIQGLKRPLVIS